jgi:hypothetical protein
MEGDSIDSGEEMNTLVSALLNLKSVLLYKKDPSLLSSHVTRLIDPEHWDMKYKIEIRPRRETDNFIGFTGLESDGTEGNRPDIDGLVYTVVGEFKNKAGETCKITLGLLANPDSYTVTKGLSEIEKRKVEQNIASYK